MIPALFITDAYSMSQKQVHRRQRDEFLMTNILTALRNDGNVLVCVDTAGRVLELAHMIDHLWNIKVRICDIFTYLYWEGINN